MSKGPAIIVGGILAGCTLIVTIVLISCSFAKVEMTEVGLLYSHASRKIDRTKIYNAGRHYVGVGGEFIKFPITQQEMHLPIFESRTEDGLIVKLDVSLNFKIIKDFEKIISIFDRFGYNYDGFISRLATNIIRDASARFPAIRYSMNRSQVNMEMERDISDDMESIGFTLDSLQLLNIEFPINFANTLQNTRMLQQQVSQARMNKDAENVTLQGELEQSKLTSKGLITDCNATANAIKQNAEAEADALISSLTEEAYSHLEMIKFFKEQLSGDDAAARQAFAKWYWMTQVAKSSATKNIAIDIPDLS